MAAGTEENEHVARIVEVEILNVELLRLAEELSRLLGDDVGQSAVVEVLANKLDIGAGRRVDGVVNASSDFLSPSALASARCCSSIW
jgi:hypothetical protein